MDKDGLSMVEICRRRAEKTRDLAQHMVEGKARQVLLGLADDYVRAAEALERGEEINGQILEYLKEGPSFRTE
jgi:hypothetical protein